MHIDVDKDRGIFVASGTYGKPTPISAGIVARAWMDGTATWSESARLKAEKWLGTLGNTK